MKSTVGKQQNYFPYLFFIFLAIYLEYYSLVLAQNLASVTKFWNVVVELFDNNWFLFVFSDVSSCNIFNFLFYFPPWWLRYSVGSSGAQRAVRIDSGDATAQRVNAEVANVHALLLDVSVTPMFVGIAGWGKESITSGFVSDDPNLFFLLSRTVLFCF